MDKEKIIEESEKFMKTHIPENRLKDEYVKHVLGTKKYALHLAKIYSADEFVVAVAVLFHDIGAYVKKHHADEAVKISKEFLSQFEIPDDILEKILDAIRTHSMGLKCETVEQQIVQDADGIIFVEDSYESFLKEKKRKFPLNEAIKLTVIKTKRMADKIKTEEGKKLVKKFLPDALKDLESD